MHHNLSSFWLLFMQHELCTNWLCSGYCLCTEICLLIGNVMAIIYMSGTVYLLFFSGYRQCSMSCVFTGYVLVIIYAALAVYLQVMFCLLSMQHELSVYLRYEYLLGHSALRP